MIGFILRGLGFGGGEGLILGLVGFIAALFALCGLYRCCSACRVRDCQCIKRCLRNVGPDNFDDFYVTILVHEALFSSSKQKEGTHVRISAGDQRVETDVSKKGIYQQALELLVEQGTDYVNVELMSDDRKLLANLKLDPEKDILKPKDARLEKMYTMKQKSKGIVNPRIKLTIHLEGNDDQEGGLLSGIDTSAMSEKTELMLRQQLYKVKHEEAEGGRERELTELELLTRGCAGPLDLFGSWGARDIVYVAVRGPPESKKYNLGFFKSQHEFEKGCQPFKQVDLLKVLSVSGDPGRPEVFIINYVGQDKTKDKLTLRRTDRPRDVWVEMFQMLIKLVREKKESRNRNK